VVNTKLKDLEEKLAKKSDQKRLLTWLTSKLRGHSFFVKCFFLSRKGNTTRV